MPSTDLIFSEERGIGRILLNRPKALNSLTHAMVKAIRQQLELWERDFTIKMVLVEGEGRAFCCGADIKALYEYGIQNAARSVDFMQDEYQLARYVRYYPKPFVALLDGVVMGGGAALSIGCSYSIATERFSFAMPEVKIGYFPDVGASYFLSRLPRYAGYYLAMTGESIGPADAKALGLIEHIISHERIQEFHACLPDAIPRALARFAIDPGPPLLDLRAIEAAFSKGSPQEIVEAFGEKHFSGKNPLSIAIAFEALKRGRHLNFDEAIAMELRLAERFFREGDFFEGVRTRLFEREDRPRWHFSNVSEIEPEFLASYF